MARGGWQCEHRNQNHPAFHERYQHEEYSGSSQCLVATCPKMSRNWRSECRSKLAVYVCVCMSMCGNMKCVPIDDQVRHRWAVQREEASSGRYSSDERWCRGEEQSTQGSCQNWESCQQEKSRSVLGSHASIICRFACCSRGGLNVCLWKGHCVFLLSHTVTPHMEKDMRRQFFGQWGRVKWWSRQWCHWAWAWSWKAWTPEKTSVDSWIARLHTVLIERSCWLHPQYYAQNWGHILRSAVGTMKLNLLICVAFIWVLLFVTGSKRSAAGQLEALTETLHEARMRELDLQERRLRLEEEQLKFQYEQWAWRQSEPVFARVPQNETTEGFRFVYANEEAGAEPDLHVMQPACVLKPHEFWTILLQVLNIVTSQTLTATWLNHHWWDQCTKFCVTGSHHRIALSKMKCSLVCWLHFVRLVLRHLPLKYFVVHVVQMLHLLFLMVRENLRFYARFPQSEQDLFHVRTLMFILYVTITPAWGLQQCWLNKFKSLWNKLFVKLNRELWSLLS